jgi:hypothetical protein
MNPFTPEHKSIDDRLKEIIGPNGKSLYQIQVGRARTTAIILALSTIATLIFLVFAFVQKAAADTAREHAVENEKRARQNAEIANHLTVELEQCRQLNSK